jgi:sugar phosphate isomerase/epimerase
MKFGANTQIWSAPFKAVDMGLIEKVAKMGFDLIELGVASEDPPFDVKEVRQRLQDAGLQSCVCSYIPADRDIASADPAIRRRGVEYLKSLVATTAALGGPILCGPLYAELFRGIRQSNPPSGRAVFLMYCRDDGNRRGWRSEAAKPPRDQTTCEGIRNQWTTAERILSQA